LEEFSAFQRNKILGAFAHALGDKRFHKQRSKPIKAESI
jgi:hypothetical protein